MELFRYLHQLILGAWMGALLFFGAAVTPVLFQTLGSGGAGQIVRQLIPLLDGFALAAVPTLLVLGFLYEGWPRGLARVRVACLLAMMLLAGISLFATSPRMSQLREQAGDKMSELPKEHPLRQEFGKLHGISTTLMLAELILGLSALAMFLRRRT
jgi:hypothetical protein